MWNEEALEASQEIILCESLIDALTFWCAGLRNVTASYGVHGFIEDHRAMFKTYGTRRVWIAYDRDDAGESAAAALAAELIASGIECLRVQFPKGMDANEYALEGKSLEAALHSAVWLGKGQAATKEETPGPVLSSLGADCETEVKSEEVLITLGDRRYRIRGLAKNLSYDLLKINLLASRGDDAGFLVDTLDLYAARQRAVFVKQAALEMGVKEELVKRDLGRVLLKLEELQDEQIRAAMELLEDPKLLDRILADFERCGVVGEETNKLVGYVAAVSQHLESPLAVLIQSSSAAGKSSLMEAILAFIPEEQRVQYSAMTGQSLFYLGETDLKNKVLAIAEEEGVSRAAYALKLLQSEGVLTIASTGKDPATGRLITHQYRVEGPVMIFLTTTAIQLDEEFMNRCLVLTVDEERGQTQAIHRLQREGILRVHRNAQRLLAPLFVANPYARELTFLDSQTRTRRDEPMGRIPVCRGRCGSGRSGICCRWRPPRSPDSRTRYPTRVTDSNGITLALNTSQGRARVGSIRARGSAPSRIFALRPGMPIGSRTIPSCRRP